MKPAILTLVLALVAACPAVAQPITTYDSRARISVSGEAVVKVTPDKIVVTLGIETSNPDMMIAKRENNDILKKAIAAIRGLGVPEKDIQTDRFSIAPKYDELHASRLIGYVVRNTLVVTLTEADKVEGLVTQVLQAGVNYVHGIDFQTTQFKTCREQARELALKAAKEKAEKMAAVLNQSVGAPIQIAENYGGWGYYSSWSNWGYGRDRGMSQNVIQNTPDGPGEISDTVALGKIAIRANVEVTFELKQ